MHLEACTHVLVRNTTIRGLGSIADYAVPQEALKANQCRHVYVENCDISGAWDNAVDFVAVQEGHVVGSRSHVIEVGFGSRSCDSDRARCTTLLAQGGWGTNVPGADVPIPNDGVTIARNIVLNPDGFTSRWEQFAVAGPRIPPAGSNVPSPARADVNLRIVDNILWNGPAGHPLGIESPALAAAVLAGNAVNTVRPVLVDPARGDYRPAAGSPLPPGWTSPPVVPPVVVPPTVTPHAPLPPLAAVVTAVPAATGRALTAFTVTFNRVVRGVSLDDFVLLRGRATVSLRGARLTTADDRTFTISGVRGTNLAGSYSLTLRVAGTGIADAAGTGLAAPARLGWRMARWVPPRA